MRFSVLLAAALVVPRAALAANPYSFDKDHPGQILSWEGEPVSSKLNLNACAKTTRGRQCTGVTRKDARALLLLPRFRVRKEFPDMTHCEQMKVGYQLMQIQTEAASASPEKTGEKGTRPTVVYLRCIKPTPGIRVLYWSDFPDDVVFPAADPKDEEARVMRYVDAPPGGINPIPAQAK